jgi:GMP synthase-like glutamine amidotransferase
VNPVLILQHQLPENAAYLTTWLDRNRILYQVVNAGAGELFPESIEPYSALAVMGGGMSANDDLPSNHQAIRLIQQAIKNYNIPVVGHCLGGQLMARALGGIIQASPRPEIGWQPIVYENDPLVEEWFGLDPTDTVIHWHYESFSIPYGAVRLARSSACPNQAFAYGKHLAMQFHIEINEVKIDSWVNDDDPKWSQARQLYESVQDKITMLNGVHYHLEKHQATADRIYTNWLKTTEWSVV